MDVAVFRFTLGIPGFEDRMIPRVVGLACAAMLVVNHVLGAQPAPDAQVRAEYLVFFLAVLGVVVPEGEQRLREALPGRGRQSMAEKVEGATNGFALAPDLPDALKQELAWASSSLIKNTNSCGVVLVKDGRALLARGALATSAFDLQERQQQPKAVLQRITQGLVSLSPLIPGAAAAAPGTAASSKPQQTQPSADVDSALAQQVYFADRSAMDASSAVAASASSLPRGAQSLLLQALPGQAAKGGPSYLVLYSERPRALSDKERRWAAAMALKFVRGLP